MKKLINRSENIVDEMIEGIVSSYPKLLARSENNPIILRKNKKVNKVALISGGGSGHEPAHAGFVGQGMLDAAVCGEIFTSPGADKVYQAIKDVKTDKGVLLIIKNYSGDVMNFEMAADLAKEDGITTKKVIVDDDIAVENSTYTVGRRGIAGTIFVHKILGAAAEEGYSLDQLETLGKKVVSRTKTLGMSLYPCYVPTTNAFSFQLEENEIEIGVGIHGEPGTHKEKIKPVDEHVEFIVNKLLGELKEKSNDKVAILVNGLGSTTLMELYVISNKVNAEMKKHKITVADMHVGNYMSSLDMAGFSITIAQLDQEMEKLLKAPADTLAFKR